MKPDFLLSRGDSNAAWAYLALEMLQDTDVFFDILYTATRELRTKVLRALVLVDQAYRARTGGVTGTQLQISAKTPSSFNGALAQVQQKTISTVSTPPSISELTGLLQDLRVWLQLYDPHFVPSVITGTHLQPLLDLIRSASSSSLATTVQAALEARADWSPQNPRWSGTLLPATTMGYPMLTGGCPPFNTAGGDLELTVSGAAQIWTVTPATQARLLGSNQSQTFSAGEYPKIIMDGGLTPTTRKAVLAGVTVGADGVVSSAALFGDAETSMYLYLPVPVNAYFPITLVMSADFLRCSGAPPAGVYVNAELHFPLELPIRVDMPLEGLANEEFVLTLPGFGPFLMTTMEALILAFNIPGHAYFQTTLAGSSLTVEVLEKSAQAAIHLQGNVAYHPWLYDAFGLTPGSFYGVPYTLGIQGVVTRTSGPHVFTAVFNPPGVPQSPTDLMNYINGHPQLSTVLLAVVEGGALAVYSLDRGDYARLEFTGLGLSGRAWGASAALIPPVGVRLDQTTADLTETKALTGDGSAILDAGISNLTTAWKAHIKLDDDTHWATYRVINVAGTVVTLERPPVQAGENLKIQFARSVMRLILPSFDPAAALAADTSAPAVDLELSGESSVGTTTLFQLPTQSGIRTNDHVEGGGISANVLHVADNVIELDSSVPAVAAAVVISSRGTQEYGAYCQIKSTVLPDGAVFNLPYLLELQTALTSLRDNTETAVLTDPQNAAARALREFLQSRKLEILSLLLRQGGLSAFFNTTDGSVAGLLAGPEAYIQYKTTK